MRKKKGRKIQPATTTNPNVMYGKNTKADTMPKTKPPRCAKLSMPGNVPIQKAIAKITTSWQKTASEKGSRSKPKNNQTKKLTANNLEKIEPWPTSNLPLLKSFNK
jgi:hypothetical protein